MCSWKTVCRGLSAPKCPRQTVCGRLLLASHTKWLATEASNRPVLEARLLSPFARLLPANCEQRRATQSQMRADTVASRLRADSSSSKWLSGRRPIFRPQSRQCFALTTRSRPLDLGGQSSSWCVDLASEGQKKNKQTKKERNKQTSELEKRSFHLIARFNYYFFTTVKDRRLCLFLLSHTTPQRQATKTPPCCATVSQQFGGGGRSGEYPSEESSYIEA